MPGRIFKVFVFSMLVSSSVAAHQQKEAYTTILFNERASTLEVQHRFYLHDAEHALQETSGESIDLTLDEASQQLFFDYLVSHFNLRLEGRILKLDPVGYEAQGKYFWVYQETSLGFDINSLDVAMSALQEVWQSQINHINVEKNGRVSSARLASNDGFTKITLETEDLP